MEQLTIEEKMLYVGRIDSKAKADNISIKHAARKLGLKEWRYFQYQNEIKAVRQAKKQPEQPQAIGISFTVAPDVWKILEERAAKYQVQPAIIAQILLHDAVRKPGQNGQS